MPSTACSNDLFGFMNLKLIGIDHHSDLNISSNIYICDINLKCSIIFKIFEFLKSPSISFEEEDEEEKEEEE